MDIFPKIDRFPESTAHNEGELIYKVEFSKEGKYMLSLSKFGNNIGKVLLWSTDTWEPYRAIVSRSSRAITKAIGFLPNKKQLYMISECILDHDSPLRKQGKDPVFILLEFFDVKTSTRLKQYYESPLGWWYIGSGVTIQSSINIFMKEKKQGRFAENNQPKMATVWLDYSRKIIKITTNHLSTLTAKTSKELALCTCFANLDSGEIFATGKADEQLVYVWNHKFELLERIQIPAKCSSEIRGVSCLRFYITTTNRLIIAVGLANGQIHRFYIESNPTKQKKIHTNDVISDVQWAPDGSTYVMGTVISDGTGLFNKMYHVDVHAEDNGKIILQVQLPLPPLIAKMKQLPVPYIYLTKGNTICIADPIDVTCHNVFSTFNGRKVVSFNTSKLNKDFYGSYIKNCEGSIVGYVTSCEIDVHLKVELYDVQNRMHMTSLVIEGMIPQKIFSEIKDDQGIIIPNDQVKKLYSKLQANGVIGPDGFLLPLRKP